MIKNYLRYLKKIDWLLLAPVMLLTVLGIASLYTGALNVENPDWTLFNKQLIFFVIGFAAMIFASAVDYRVWKSYSMILYLGSIILLAAVLVWGATIRGTTGWFYFFGFGLQPVELAKFILVISLAYIYTKRKGRENEPGTILRVAILTVIPAVLAMLQPDFGSAAVILAIGLGFFCLLSMKSKYLIILLIALVILTMLAWDFLLLDYQKTRISTFLNPLSDPLGKGYNVRQSVIAIGSGQLLGRGLGLGTQSQLRFLPETQTDFIFATIAETLGFLGVVLVIGLFLALFLRLMLIMRKARDDFSCYLVYGFGFIFFVQMVINVGMNMGLLPVAGLSLPFVSYGGSFLIVAMFAVGVVVNIRLKQKII
ncbi:rod shape-determining protein RodA [Candidatus Kuenenbacteria bacterium RIFCSPHIGHO2_02_FULL_39_13]|uniref:Rod shape-determining protein RodA n=1 Tax=Candidatus Kuenenbacteria bacterium RIFCSPHIGHO2_02_FULL_39_13 TaxID=1798561 RepID=A0A1F6FNC4_9BACT|nr:MAG: rod shape-determining protein RodA [Candidatus Kuenenbacteria bacterium RIFCSPHIGHO2_02_FULL_39_13]